VKFPIVLMISAGLVVSGCTSLSNTTLGAGAHNGKIVRASYYGGGERLARHTANGEVFRPSAYTAAHRSLPFGTRLRVTNLDNHRSVVVRINDRGPAAYTGRSLDLAKGAAENIGLVRVGEARVSIERLN
jgi:rare lipoprotein A